MASRMMHLAIIEQITSSRPCRDKNRLRLGAIFPDAAVQGNSHLKILVCGGIKKTYDLTGFRNAYLQRMLTDDFYLGYYLHLLQDLRFQNFVYHRHWNPRPQGNPQRLHNDYALLNRPLAQKYGIQPQLTLPAALEQELICQQYRFDAHACLEELQADFELQASGESFFFTDQMADQYIEDAARCCLREIDSLFFNRSGVDELALAWKRV